MHLIFLNHKLGFLLNGLHFFHSISFTTFNNINELYYIKSKYILNENNNLIYKN